MDSYFSDPRRTAADQISRDVDLLLRTPADDAALRILLRHFSKKDGAGRSFGPFAVKLLAERVLERGMTLSTSPQDGTTFRLALPRASGDA